MKNQEMLALISLIADYHGESISESRMQMFASDLSDYSAKEINEAWKKYRSTPTNLKMPMPAVLKQLVDDGHPTAQESWAMIPRDDRASVVWSDQMRSAYAVAEPLIREGNISGAFFAYREEYDRLIANARMNRQKPKWSASFGDDKSGRDAALIVAIEKGRLTPERAVQFYPELEYNPNYEILTLGYQKKQSELEFKNKEKLKKLVTAKNI